MSSDELDPKLEAATRLFIHHEQELSRDVFLPSARRWLSGWRRRREEVATATEASEKDSSLIDEILHDKTLQRLDEKTQRELDEKVRDLLVLREKSDEEVARFARKPQELEREKRDTLKRLLEKLYDSREQVEQRFRPFAQLLADEEVRRRVSRRVANELLPIMDELFVMFEIPERSETGTPELERRLLSELQRIADEEIITTVVSGGLTTDQKTQQIGDRVESRPRHSRSQSQPREVDPSKGLIARIKSHGEHTAERIAVLMDEAIEKFSPKVQLTCAPLDEWKQDAPSELRTWKEFLDHKPTHKRVRNYINGVPALPSEISKKSN